MSGPGGNSKRVGQRPLAQHAGEHKFVEQRLQDSNRGFELGAIGILHFLSVEDGR